MRNYDGERLRTESEQDDDFRWDGIHEPRAHGDVLLMTRLRRLLRRGCLDADLQSAKRVERDPGLRRPSRKLLGESTDLQSTLLHHVLRHADGQ
jgi:hypothetical protein